MIKKHFILFFIFFEIFSVSSQNISVTLTKNDQQCTPGNSNISIISGVPPISYLWSNGSTASAIDQLQKGGYSVKVTDGMGKDTIVRFRIDSLFCPPYIETYLTPNGDGFYDTWSISGLEKYPDFELWIYNRWGQTVHHQSNSYRPWDGTSLNLPLPDATYYYVIYLVKKNKDAIIKGDVSIIR
jgi:gliding motility-associated-like protein